MDEPRLSLTEHAVLGVLVIDGPAHGFAIARALAADGGIGRVMTVSRSLAYRALDRLVAEGLARPTRVEAGDGPQRVVHRVTARGRRRFDAWLARPVRHMRDLRLEFRLKLVLLERSDRSPLALIGAQRDALRPAFEAILGSAGADERDDVELWRWHSTAAIAAYLDDLEARHGKKRRRIALRGRGGNG